MDDLDRPNLSEQELYEYLYYEEDLPVTRRGIKDAVLRREILPTRIGRGNYFSKRDGLNWIASRRQSGHYRLNTTVKS
ncbi:hypothetical protein C5U48_09400 [Mycolicibacter virginiensis]|uniref:Uncharacterized protein n=2 Tax=Mycolicibacter virginiensis TaxID=1795032 RepID=A0A9X7INE1_9MYCO|nr:hypothetical protein C5U48_09400 [Mycolicibacter virginiensis]